MADVGRALGDLTSRGRQDGPSGACPCIEQVADLVGVETDASPLEIGPKALKAARALAEAVDVGDDLPAKAVLRVIPQIRRPGGLQRGGKVRRVGRVADEVGLEVGRLDLGLQPGEDDLVFGRRPEVIHQAWENNTSMPQARKWIYQFTEGSAKMRDLLGGKGAGAAEMTRAGMPVPPGFTITTEACRAYYASGGKFPKGLWEQVLPALKILERKAGKKFGNPKDPLLVSVRSGAKFSMPGMMDTVLNLGLNEETAAGVAALTKDERFALDAYRRFIQMFGKTVKGIDGEKFEHALRDAKKRAGVKTDPELKPYDLRPLVARFLAIYKEETRSAFPTDPVEQLREAIDAVFRSWNTDRAKTYRRMERIPDDLGTAVNVQMMVFGNMGSSSGTGVAFTRNPITGAKELYGDYLANAQGEDVVAGVRDTEPISALKKELPKVYAQFDRYARQLEKHYKDVQDLEFTIERGKLYMLQTRSAKRTGEAAVNIAVDMVKERLITKREAVARVEPRQLEQLLFPRVDPNAKVHPLARGVPASPGAASGGAVFDADTAVEGGKQGKAVILVRVETNPNDVHGMVEAKGILTQTGGTASHAALVAL